MNESNKASLQTVFFKIGGMSCAACSSRVERVLSKLPGIEKAAVNLAVEKATVTFDSTQITFNEIAKKVQDLGYRAITDKVDLKITGMTCAACSGRVEKVLDKLPGIATAVVNLALERATVEYYPGVITVTDIKKRIE